MTWIESLAKLNALGYSLYRGQNTIKYKFFGKIDPQRARVQPLLKVLAENKAEVLKTLREEPSRDNPRPSDLSSILDTDLKQFGESGIGIRIWSELLGKEIWLIPRDSDIRKIPKGETSYTVAELEILVNSNLGPQGLRMIDSIKDSFGVGKITEIRKDSGLSPSPDA
jgi:hypothetical protein